MKPNHEAVVTDGSMNTVKEQGNLKWCKFFASMCRKLTEFKSLGCRVVKRVVLIKKCLSMWLNYP